MIETDYPMVVLITLAKTANYLFDIRHGGLKKTEVSESISTSVFDRMPLRAGLIIYLMLSGSDRNSDTAEGCGER